MTSAATIPQAEITRLVRGAAKAMGVPAADLEVIRSADGTLRVRIISKQSDATPGSDWDEVLK